MSVGAIEVATTPWNWDEVAGADGLCRQAQRAEAMGFHSFWLPENHFGDARALPAPLLLLAAVAGRTSTLRLGCTSYLLPIRHPLLAAEEVGVLDRLCGGRLILGVGRGIHLGDTVLGTKGRVAFEAPAAEVLITAHRELEKLVLSAEQSRIKETLAMVYGDLVHEGRQLDLACRDIEALFVSSQQRVTGDVSFTLRPGNLFVTGTSSPFSLMAASAGVYGEAAGEWTAADALGYSRILSLAGSLQTRAGRG